MSLTIFLRSGLIVIAATFGSIRAAVAQLRTLDNAVVRERTRSAVNPIKAAVSLIRIYVDQTETDDMPKIKAA
jgi:hypothetical protein